MEIQTLSLDPRITVRKPGAPNPEGKCVVYWMQRAQRALDNPALDVAVELGNELGKPLVPKSWNGIRRLLPLTNGRFG